VAECQQGRSSQRSPRSRLRAQCLENTSSRITFGMLVITQNAEFFGILMTALAKYHSSKNRSTGNAYPH